MEAKRSHQWFMDSPGPELFSNKKQAVEHSSNNRPVAGMSHMNISPWNNTSSFQSVSGHFSDRLFGSEPLRPNNGSNFFSSGNGNMNMGRKDFIYGSNCSMGLSMSHNIEDPSASISFGGIRKDKGNSGILSMGHNYNKGDNNAISFGGFDDEPETCSSGNIITGYELLVSNQDTAQTSEVSAQNVLPQANSDPQLNTDSAPKIIADPQLNSDLEANSKTDTDIKGKEPKASINAAPKNQEPKTPIGSTSKNKELKTSKKVPANNFPSNVKSLLSTGLLDGVPVKYVSWSREKTLQGIIKGTGYLCGCKECGSNKALNAYEFERHANCKTKHPNNHIFFENGKTIYAVVQELKSTPQEVLFNAIQTVTGSHINQKNFCIWKASYQAATRELQRIYGKDEVTVPS
ncbi:hypothetical protein D5086_015846 [Populus alba]|uniref:Uncharacterized protein n=1 Tax=Populus alba TaxID=43335 RepID=A0ACC4BTU8_POPAL